MKALFKKLANLGLVRQVTIVFSLIMIIPALVLTLSYVNIVQNSLLEESQKKVSESLKKMDTNISVNLVSANNVINQILFSQELNYFLDSQNKLSTRELDYYEYNMQNDLLDIQREYPNKFIHIVVYSKNKQINEQVNWSYHLDRLYNRDYYKEILQNNTNDCFYGSVRAYDSTLGNLADYKELKVVEEPVLPIYKKIYNLSTNEFIGLVEIDLTLDKLVNKEDFINSEEGVNYLIFDRKGNLSFTSDTSTQKNFTHLSFQGASGVSEIKRGGATYLTAFSKDSTTGLTCVALMNKKDILSSSSVVGGLLLLVAFLSIGFIVVFTYLAARIMFHKLREISKIIPQIEVGRFDVRVKVSGSNEVSRIAESFNHMAEKLQSVITEIVQKEKEQKSAEMNALQAQINPHFLYNALENMRMQCEIDEYYTLADNIVALGDLLRYSIKWEHRVVTLDEELNNIQHYIEIMRMRFSSKLEYILNCESDLGKIMVPKFILQPLVENCFNHGFKNSDPPWIVKITVFRQDNSLIIQVEDNGVGISSERLSRIQECINGKQPTSEDSKHKNSIGIFNVKQRIEMLCPSGSGLNIDSQYGSGTKITVTIVLNKNAQIEGGMDD